MMSLQRAARPHGSLTCCSCCFPFVKPLAINIDLTTHLSFLRNHADLTFSWPLKEEKEVAANNFTAHFWLCTVFSVYHWIWITWSSWVYGWNTTVTRVPFLCSWGSLLLPCLRSHWGSEWVRDSELTVAAKYTDYVLCFIMLRDQVNQQL